MNTSIPLDNLSLESDEVFGDDIRVDTAGEDVLDNPVYGQQFDDMMLVFDTYNTIRQRKYVCRDDVCRLEPLSKSYPSLQRMFNRYPVASFTQEPSMTNFDVSTESFGKTAYDAVMQALRNVLKFIADAFRNLWAFLTESAQKTQAVDDLEPHLDAIRSYINKIEEVLSQRSYRKDYDNAVSGAIKSSLSNLNKQWNGMYDLYITDPVKFKQFYADTAGIIRDILPNFVDVSGKFMSDLMAAQNEADVDAAVSAISSVVFSDQRLTALVNEYGYKAVASDRVTPFHSQALYVKNVFKTMINNRTRLEEPKFRELVTSFTPDQWAGEINATIDWSQKKTKPLLELLRSFDDKKLAPQLADLYSSKLSSVFILLTSMTQGVVILEQCMGMMVTTRNQAVRHIAQSALSVAKQLDSIVMKDRESFNLIDRATLAEYRRALVAVLK